MVERPSTAFRVLFVAGLAILLFGVLFGSVGYWGLYETRLIIFGVAFVCGIVVILAGVLLYALPEYHVFWGTLGVAFSLLSFFCLGGLFIGLTLGIIGGAMGITWKPSPPSTGLCVDEN